MMWRPSRTSSTSAATRTSSATPSRGTSSSASACSVERRIYGRFRSRYRRPRSTSCTLLRERRAPSGCAFDLNATCGAIQSSPRRCSAS
ncbi:MAG: hypothetical protein ACK55Z_18235, partial [bacterium]